MGVRLKGVSYGLQRVLYIHGYVCEHEAGNVNGISYNDKDRISFAKGLSSLEIDTLSQGCVVRKID
jgi:hypothetical protein